ncbi:hypothetical protein [uncultured Apibacter sp.]|uniref:hypothetical protein n=1 Tax=uncultured Apibacter sp. TaxID=1778616 RepID=UPI0025E53360|nr:hypothetical protein [uncultured Apibacter sp.]
MIRTIKQKSDNHSKFTTARLSIYYYIKQGQRFINTGVSLFLNTPWMDNLSDIILVSPKPPEPQA